MWVSLPGGPLFDGAATWLTPTPMSTHHPSPTPSHGATALAFAARLGTYVLIGICGLILAAISIKIWYLTLPVAAGLVYIWKKTAWPTKAKNSALAGATLACFIAFGVLIGKDMPAITIEAPTGTIAGTTTEVRGRIEPPTSTLRIGNTEVPVNAQGAFAHSVDLPQQETIVTLIAKNNDATAEKELTLRREPTTEETAAKAQQEAAAAQAAEAQKQAQLAAAEAEKATTPAATDTTKQTAEQTRAAEAVALLQKDLNAIADFHPENAPNTGLMLIGVLAMENAGKNALKYKNDPDTSVRALAEELEEKMMAKQDETFPALRRNYVSLIKEPLRKVGVEVTSSGRTITFTGITFSEKTGIVSFHEAGKEALQKLRFSTVRYQWSAADDNPATYTLDVPRDRTIVE